MNYGEYRKLWERYQGLNALTFTPEETKEQVIQKLLDAAYQKKEIQTSCDAIIEEWIVTYEKNPELVDETVKTQLTEFFESLKLNEMVLYDDSMAARIQRIFLNYAKRQKDIEGILKALAALSYHDTVMNEHLESATVAKHALMVEEYEPYFKELSMAGKKAYLVSLFRIPLGRKHIDQCWKDFKRIQPLIEVAKEEMGDDFPRDQFGFCRVNMVGQLAEMFRTIARAKKTGAPLPEVDFCLEEEKAALLELNEKVYDAVTGNQIRYNAILALIYCLQVQYHTGVITLEELLAKFKEHSKVNTELDLAQQMIQQFMIPAYYLEYLYCCSEEPEETIQERAKEIVNQVMHASKSMFAQGNFAASYFILVFINAASKLVDFTEFKKLVLDATVYCNPTMYIHALMVEKISLVLADYVLEHNPEYFAGVAEYDEAYIRTHKQEMRELLAESALFHDIGKYFCMDFVTHSYRSLTEEEYDVIKCHTTNFAKAYQGEYSVKMDVLKDCAFLHHRWYDEKGGYPELPHTKNKPFVDILSVADSLDAATDGIGRPYSIGKNFDELVEEFCTMGGERYSDYVTKLLRIPEIKKKLGHLIKEEREEINYKVYTGRYEN